MNSLTQSLEKLWGKFLPAIAHNVLSNLANAAPAANNLSTENQERKSPAISADRAAGSVEVDARPRFSIVAGAGDQALTQAQTACERAIADAPYITSAMLKLIRDPDISSLENREFIRMFIAALPASEQGDLHSNGADLVGEGRNRVRNAVLLRAYGNAEIISRATEASHRDIDALLDALTGAASAWVTLRAAAQAGEISADLDMTPELMEAVLRIIDLNSMGEELGDYLARIDALENFRGEVEALMSAFYDEPRGRLFSDRLITEFLRYYVVQALSLDNEHLTNAAKEKDMLRIVEFASRWRSRPSKAAPKSAMRNKSKSKK